MNVQIINVYNSESQLVVLIMCFGYININTLKYNFNNINKQ